MRANDILIVTRLIDPYLNKTVTKKKYDPQTGKMTNEVRSVIVDDGALPGNDPMMTGSQVATAQMLKGIDGNESSVDWWVEYGKRVNDKFKEGEFGIRCDTCTALAFYLLKENNCTGSITVIEQAQGKANGHWFLLVGCPEDAKIAYPDIFPRGSFVVDLWGAGVKMQRKEQNIHSAVFDPSRCVYSCGDNSLKRKVHLGGATTVPTKGQFVTDTTIAGCFGNKGRSSALKKLDTQLDLYHKNQNQPKDLADAFTDWTAKKNKRQGEDIDTIRNKEGAMTRLRSQIRWLGKPV
ncbi:MAG: hypothetical protein AB7T38_17815 [Nitrospirales bacterium]